MTYPNLKQSIWLMVLWILITLGLSILIAIVGNIVGKPVHEYDYVLGLLALVNFILILCYVSHRADRTWKDLLPLQIIDIDYNWRMWLSVGVSILGLGGYSYRIIPCGDNFFANARRISGPLSSIFRKTNILSVSLFCRRLGSTVYRRGRF